MCLMDSVPPCPRSSNNGIGLERRHWVFVRHALRDRLNQIPSRAVSVLIYIRRPSTKNRRSCAPRDWKSSSCCSAGPAPPPPFPGAPPPGPPVGGKTKADATAAIKACAEKKKAMPVWQSASVDPFIGGNPPNPSLVKREREIPPDVQGCCCGAKFS